MRRCFSLRRRSFYATFSLITDTRPLGRWRIDFPYMLQHGREMMTIPLISCIRYTARLDALLHAGRACHRRRGTMAPDMK